MLSEEYKFPESTRKLAGSAICMQVKQYETVLSLRSVSSFSSFSHDNKDFIYFVKA